MVVSSFVRMNSEDGEQGCVADFPLTPDTALGDASRLSVTALVRAKPLRAADVGVIPKGYSSSPQI